MRGEFIDLAGERIYYYAAGSRGSGEPIVLVHGFPTSGHLWLDVVAKLPPGHRVIVVDLLGFGRSDAPVKADYSVVGHARRMLRLLDALGIDRACLVGHGTGGSICEWLALQAPDRVSRLVLVGSSTREGFFSRSRMAMRTTYDLLLRLPAAIWAPVLRGTIARAYSDSARGQKSADMYVAPFLTNAGPRVLRHHLGDLTNGDIEALAARAHEQRVPVFTTPKSAWRFMPEENPSDVAALIAEALG